MSDEEPHSILNFGESREYWWNQDYLELIARRASLGTRRRVLDVGTGFGHFARALLPHLMPGVELTGIDPERVSVAEAERRTRAFLEKRGLNASLRFQVAAGESLPFPDASFDAVVAQTVLIHVKDPAVVVREMARVLAPGGLLLLAEPNNIAGSVATLIQGPDIDLQTVLRLTEFEARCELGKAKLGLGFNSLGETLSRYVPDALFHDFRAWQWDRTMTLRPPYETPGARAEIAERRDFSAKGIYIWPREMAKSYYLASGATEADFDREYALGLEYEKAWLAKVDRGELHALAAGDCYLAIATRR
ncbi:MAG: class I SAM-dependent methyltransferase [Myxococcota bacterium]